MICLVAAPPTAQSHPQASCAAYDLHLVTLIEDHGLTGEIAPSELGEAAQRMVAARLACREGDALGALQIYDDIRLERSRMTPFYRVLLPDH